MIQPDDGTLCWRRAVAEAAHDIVALPVTAPAFFCTSMNTTAGNDTDDRDNGFS
jgi:hypothetical protein